MAETERDGKQPRDPEFDGSTGLWPAELEVHAAAAGPVGAALVWMEYLRTGRLADAWLRTDTPFRLLLSRHWCWRHRFTLSEAGYEPFQVARELSENGPAHPLWPTFARDQAPGVGPEHVLPGGWVAAGPPEPAAPDLEIVRLAPASSSGIRPDDPVMTLVLRLGPSGWLIAGHGGMPAPPRWPPGSLRSSSP